MNAALEILTAERDAVAVTICSQQSYLATLKTEIAKTMKNLAANETSYGELVSAVNKIN